jgi:hypothetical protein
MWRFWMGTLLLVVLLSSATFVSAQAQPMDQVCEGCASKVFQLPDSTKPYESQDVVNLFRTVVELRFIQQDVSHHTISIKGTPEQVEVAEKLAGVLESLRSGGDHAMALTVYAPAGQNATDSGTHEMTPSAVDRKLTSSYVKALYTPKSSMQQMQTFTDKLRGEAHIVRLQTLPSLHVTVVRGDSHQVTEAERLMNE